MGPQQMAIRNALLLWNDPSSSAPWFRHSSCLFPGEADRATVEVALSTADHSVIRGPSQWLAGI